MRPWLIFLLLGILLIIGGFLAILNPFAASLLVTTLVGFFFLVSGILQLWLAFSDSADPHRMWHALTGILGIVTGVLLLANPLQGLISLTLLLGVLFLVTGITRLVMAFRLRDSQFFWLLLLSGAGSTLLGILIFANFAPAASTLLGLLLGFELLADGAGLIAVGMIGRRSL